VNQPQLFCQIAREGNLEADVANPLLPEGLGQGRQFGVKRARRILQPDRRGETNGFRMAERLDEPERSVSKERSRLRGLVEHCLDRVRRLQDRNARASCSIARSDGNVDSADPVEPVRTGAGHHIHNAWRRANPAQREQPGAAELAIAAQLPPGDVKQSAEIAVVAAQRKGGVHDPQIEIVMAGIDQNGGAAHSPYDSPWKARINLDHLDSSPKPGDERSRSTGVAIGDNDFDLRCRGFRKVADDDTPHGAGATHDGDTRGASRRAFHRGISSRLCV
jgi:hypothetical protein